MVPILPSQNPHLYFLVLWLELNSFLCPLSVLFLFLSSLHPYSFSCVCVHVHVCVCMCLHMEAKRRLHFADLYNQHHADNAKLYWPLKIEPDSFDCSSFYVPALLDLGGKLPFSSSVPQGSVWIFVYVWVENLSAFYWEEILSTQTAANEEWIRKHLVVIDRQNFPNVCQRKHVNCGSPVPALKH